jgi:hypothetical protein
MTLQKHKQKRSMCPHKRRLQIERQRVIDTRPINAVRTDDGGKTWRVS